MSDSAEQLIARARYTGPAVSAEHLIGVDACLKQLEGQLALLARPELADRFGLEVSGTLFIGPPGTGKTHLARYLAGRLGIPLYQFSADEFGSDPDLVHAVFRGLASAPSVALIDEISILAQRRDWSDSDDRRMLAALLTSLDGLTTGGQSARPWVIGACTPDIRLDRAIYRSGRLGVVVEFALPSKEQREELFRLYLRNVPHTLTEADVEQLADVANGASGADIRDWISQAASESLAESPVGDPVIEQRHVETVVVRRGFVPATGRSGRAPDLRVCLHEAAHAVVALSVFGREALARVSVGFTRSAQLTEYSRGHFELSDAWLLEHPPTSLTWRDHAAVAVAGAIAEDVFLGDRAAGAEADMRRATQLILGQLDLGDPLFGPARSEVEEATSHQAAVGSEVMRGTTWSLVRWRFDAVITAATEIVEVHRVSIERLAAALLDAKTTLNGDEVVALLESGASVE